MILQIFFKGKTSPLEIPMDEAKAKVIIDTYSDAGNQNDIRFSEFEIHKKSSIAGLKYLSGKANELGREEIIEFEKFLKGLETSKLNKPLSYYSDNGICSEKTDWVSSIFNCHWSFIDYMEQNKIIRKDEGGRWVITNNKEYSELYRKYQALKELWDKRDYARKKQEEEFNSLTK